jgi:hypothetical protein
MCERYGNINDFILDLEINQFFDLVKKAEDEKINEILYRQWLAENMHYKKPLSFSDFRKKAFRNIDKTNVQKNNQKTKNAKKEKMNKKDRERINSIAERIKTKKFKTVDFNK